MNENITLGVGERQPPRTPAECEARLLRAFATTRAIVGRVGPRGAGAAWPGYKYSPIDLKYQEARPVRWQPDSRDLADREAALGWLSAALTGHSRAAEIGGVIEGRSFAVDRDRPRTWASLGLDAGVTGSAARHWYLETIERAWRVSRRAKVAA